MQEPQRQAQTRGQNSDRPLAETSQDSGGDRLLSIQIGARPPPDNATWRERRGLDDSSETHVQQLTNRHHRQPEVCGVQDQ